MPKDTLVLVADDERHNRETLVRLMSRYGYRVLAAEDGVEALAILEQTSPDLVILDVNMPRLSGLDACRRIKADVATRLIPVILVTGLGASSDRIMGIEAGADDFLSKPFSTAELQARAKSLIRLKRYTDELESAESVIISLALTIEARDQYTSGHCERLAHLAARLGAGLGLSEADQLTLYRGGYLHDVGKVGIPDAILLKPEELTADEYRIMQQHTLIGDGLCGRMRSLADVRPIVRHHHERLDGSGYPDQLSGDDVPLLAQIMNVVDSYDAMTTDRPYRRGLTPEAAIEELRRDVMRGWKDQGLVEKFVEIMTVGSCGQAPELPVLAPARLA